MSTNDSSHPLGSLDGQVALVTGASRGIGQAIATMLARAGATVIGTATSAAGAEAIGQHLGAPHRGVALDVNDAAACAALVDQIVADHGKLSILVNNAGITRDTLAMRMKDEDWEAVIDTNLSAVFRMARLAIKPMMKARQGRIINITSVVGQSGNDVGQQHAHEHSLGAQGDDEGVEAEAGDDDPVEHSQTYPDDDGHGEGSHQPQVGVGAQLVGDDRVGGEARNGGEGDVDAAMAR